MKRNFLLSGVLVFSMGLMACSSHPSRRGVASSQDGFDEPAVGDLTSYDGIVLELTTWGSAEKTFPGLQRFPFQSADKDFRVKCLQSQNVAVAFGSNGGHNQYVDDTVDMFLLIQRSDEKLYPTFFGNCLEVADLPAGLDNSRVQIGMQQSQIASIMPSGSEANPVVSGDSSTYYSYVLAHVESQTFERDVKARLYFTDGHELRAIRVWQKTFLPSVNK